MRVAIHHGESGCHGNHSTSLPAGAGGRLLWSAVFTMGSLFGVGVARAAVTSDRWWRTGLEMLALGAIVAVAAYGAGALVTVLVN